MVTEVKNGSGTTILSFTDTFINQQQKQVQEHTSHDALRTHKQSIQASVTSYVVVAGTGISVSTSSGYQPVTNSISAGDGLIIVVVH